MAHANPEYALGLRSINGTPANQLKRDPVGFGQLFARMRDLESKIRDFPDLVTAEERRAVEVWRTHQRQQRRIARAPAWGERTEPGGGMHGGGRAGERFTEPKRRYPSDVQAGRVRDCDHTIRR